MALSYLGCILLVVLALLVRFSVTIGRRSREQHQAAVRNAVMVGRAEEAKTARSLLAGLGRRSEGRRQASRLGGHHHRHLGRARPRGA